ncbi:MAG: TadE/TadG family type IV pilus assembly protein [Anaerolineales bacterium]|nr:TadE/TadG family type IV pilus assembly protein [Anaerolineales bacterium]
MRSRSLPLRRRGVKTKKKSRGQSIVEFMVLLPVLLMMLSGLIEFGFLLNYYLDVIDAAREAARFAANDDPLHNDATGVYQDPNCQFYLRTQTVTEQSLNIGSGGQISLNPASDDIIISAFSVLGGTVDKRYPVITTGCPALNVVSGAVSRYANHTTGLDTTGDIEAKLNPGAPNTGMVSVEIYYDYYMVLGLPWIRAFVPDPVTLWAYSIMPNVNVEPTPTPVP